MLKHKYHISNIDHFKNELEIHDLHIILKLETQYKNLLDVLYKMINYPVHERENPFLGTFFKKDTINFKSAKIKKFNEEDIELAHKLSDSHQSFVLYNENTFKGLIIFKQKIVTEKDIIDILDDTESILITSSQGINKIYFKGYIFTNDGKNWECKYPLQFYLKQMQKSLQALINTTIISIISFAFYILSPNQIGATIVYWFSDIKRKNKIATLKKESFNVNNETDIMALRNLMYTTDGAIFIDKEGNFINYGIHLSNSKKSKKAVPNNPFTGTRHNSAQRYSFDNKKCLVITVSKDGPVTIYSKGDDIGHLK